MSTYDTIDGLLNLRDSFQQVNSNWNTSIDLNDLKSIEQYPFQESFSDLVPKTENWINDTILGLLSRIQVSIRCNTKRVFEGDLREFIKENIHNSELVRASVKWIPHKEWVVFNEKWNTWTITKIVEERVAV